MPKRSSGLLLYRRRAGGLEVLLAHPGGPFWARRDAGAWSIPKGECEGDEAAADAARREFREETGSEPPAGPQIDLGTVRQKSGKIVQAFALAGDFDPDGLRSNMVEITWPPRSGGRLTVPEIDRVAWFGLAEAARRILEAQRPLLDRLATLLGEAELSPAPARPPSPGDPGTGGNS